MKYKKGNLSDNEKRGVYDYLVKLVNTLHKKEKCQYHDLDDLEYDGIRESVKRYLYEIILYLSNLINNHKSNEWKIQINMGIKFISSKDTGRGTE